MKQTSLFTRRYWQLRAYQDRRLRRVIALTALLSAFLSTSVMAQNSDTTQRSARVIEEVIVTANKREENLRDIAGSVSAFTGESLEEMGAQSLEDYLKLEPGVTLRGEGENRSVPTIRGIGIQNQVGPSQTGFSTGIFFDDIPFSDLLLPVAVPDIHPFDLQRVEVLKGPQGTVFGAQALAGAIRFIPNKPSLDEFELNLRGTYSRLSDSDDPSKILTGMVNVPITEDFAVRVVVIDRESAGTIDDRRRGIEDTDSSEQSGGRVLARWQPTDKLNINALYFTQEFDQPDVSYADNRERRDRNNTAENQPYAAEYDALALNLEYDFDWFSFYATVNEYTKEVAFQVNTGPQLGENSAMPPLDQFPVRNFLAGENTGYFQEFRISEPAGYEGNWKWLLGVAYLKNELQFNQKLESPGIEDNLEPLNPVLNPIGLSSANFQVIVVNIDNRAEESSIFGSIAYTFWDKLELAIAGRSFETKLDNRSRVRGAQAIISLQEVDARNREKTEESGFNPAYTVKYTFNDNVLAFAKAAKGFQFGGVQIVPTDLDGAVQSYDSSELWNYELGTRTTWFDSRLQFDATAFYLDWTDLQLSVRDGSGLFTIIQNLGQARAYGVEVGTQIVLWDGLTLSGSATWLDAITKEDFDTAAGIVPEGTPLPGSADFQGAGVLSYAFPMGRVLPYFSDWTANASVSYSHIGTANADLQQNSSLGGYHTIDAGLGLRKTSGRWQPEVSLQLINIKDVRGITSAASLRQDLFGSQSAELSQSAFFNRPRTLMLTLGIKY